MKNITVRYNPFNGYTGLMIDKDLAAKEGGRFQTVVGSNRMEHWLSPNVKGYRRWAGFLPELMEEMNDDALEICFEGTQADYDVFHAELERQRRAVENLGFASDQYRVTFRKWDLEKVLTLLTRLCAEWQENLVSGQEEAMQRLLALLQKEDAVSVESLKNCRQLAGEIARESYIAFSSQEKISVENLKKQKFWKNALSSLEGLFQIA